MEELRCLRGTVVKNLESTGKFEAIRELLRKAPAFRCVDEIDDVEDAVLSREKMLGTGLGNGVAVAHGKTPAVGRVVMALGISNAGIDFGAHDGAPVRFLFVVANPPGMQLEYLLALSVIIRVIRDERFRSELSAYRSARQIEKRLASAFESAMIKRGFPFT